MHRRPPRPLLLLSCCLAACGGGGGDSPPPAAPNTPVGWWTGSTSGGRAVKALVLSSGAYYLYHEDGLVYGQGSVNGATFTDAGARHYRLAGNATQAGTLSATFSPRSRFDGSQADAGGTLAWTATWDNANAGSASTGAVAGAYAGVFAAQPTALPAAFNVAGNGQFAGLTGTCVFSGRLTPRVDVNAYDLTIAFGGFPCTMPNQDFAGVAYYDATGRSLVGLATNAARDSAALLLASRP